MTAQPWLAVIGRSGRATHAIYRQPEPGASDALARRGLVACETAPAGPYRTREPDGRYVDPPLPLKPLLQTGEPTCTKCHARTEYWTG
ncbi:MAG: hypothetical protein Q7T55_25465 [Solirubrobacteraceae bacterium]|nr:hypothetical protein [Solirubrobacteraceae bacterium]